MSAREQLIATESEAMRAAFRRWMQAVYGLDMDTENQYYSEDGWAALAGVSIYMDLGHDSEVQTWLCGPDGGDDMDWADNLGRCHQGACVNICTCCGEDDDAEPLCRAHYTERKAVAQ